MMLLQPQDARFVSLNLLRGTSIPRYRQRVLLRVSRTVSRGEDKRLVVIE